MAMSGGHLFYKDSYRENYKNLLVQAFDIWYVASSSLPLPRLFKI